MRLGLKQGVTIDSLPHQLEVCGGGVPAVVPGHAPLCLRCKRRGHIRKNCRAPWCQQCRRVGHASEDCVRSYTATVTGVPFTDDAQDLQMDEEEADDTARSESQQQPPAPTTNEQENPATPSPAPVPPSPTLSLSSTLKGQAHLVNQSEQPSNCRNKSQSSPTII